MKRKKETNSGEGQRSHLFMVSVQECFGWTDRRSDTHTLTLQRCPLSPKIFRHAHTPSHPAHHVKSHTHPNPRNQHLYNPTCIASTEHLVEVAAVLHSACVPGCSMRLPEDLLVQWEFRERSGSSLCIF